RPQQMQLRTVLQRLRESLDLPEIARIHRDHIMESLEICGPELPRRMLQLHAPTPRLTHGARVRRGARAVVRCTRRIDLEMGRQTFLPHDLSEHRLRQRRATDIAEANEQHSDLLLHSISRCRPCHAPYVSRMSPYPLPRSAAARRLAACSLLLSA